MACQTILLTLLGSSIAAAGTISSGLTVDQITSRMMQADEQRRTNLTEYSVNRKYILQNSHMKRNAEMVVKVTYRKGEGKTFQVIENKAEGLSKRVFQHLLDAEKDTGRQARGRLNSQNYSFELLGIDTVQDRRCYVLALHPKAKTKDVLNGKVWVDAEDFAVSKLEGTPAASLSFWAGKPFISQTWEKTGDFWMAARNRSRSESMLLGASELTVENRDYDFTPDPQISSPGQAATPGPDVSLLRASRRSDRP